MNKDRLISSILIAILLALPIVATAIFVTDDTPRNEVSPLIIFNLSCYIIAGIIGLRSIYKTIKENL